MTYDTAIYYLQSSRNADIRYIGITCETLKKRLTRHKWDASKAKRGYCYRVRWIRSELKDGFDIIITPIVTGIDYRKALLLEISLIKEGREIGLDLVNTTDGGEGYRGKHTAEHNAKKGMPKGHKWSAEVRARMSAGMKGKVISAEHRKKISEAGKGRVVSEETRAKLSKPNPNKRPSELNIKKITLFSTGRKKTAIENEKRCAHFYAAVDQYSMSGEFIRNWISPSKARNELDIDSSSIIAVCKLKRKSAGGFKWKYSETYKPRKRDYEKGNRNRNKR